MLLCIVSFSQDLQKYLKSANAANIIEEAKRSGNIDKTAQNKLIRLAAACLLNRTKYPTQPEKIALAKTLLFSFPQLKCADTTKDDIVSKNDQPKKFILLEKYLYYFNQPCSF